MLFNTLIFVSYIIPLKSITKLNNLMMFRLCVVADLTFNSLLSKQLKDIILC